MSMSSRYDEIERSTLPPVYLEDLDSILPQVLKVTRRMSDDECVGAYITNVAIYDTLENAMKDSWDGCLGDGVNLSPTAEIRIEARIKAQAELRERQAPQDNELADICRSILMAGMRR